MLIWRLLQKDKSKNVFFSHLEKIILLTTLIIVTFFGIAFLISNVPIVWLIVLGAFAFLIMELFFWIDKQQLPKSWNRLLFTALKKLEALGETLFCFAVAGFVYEGIQKLKPYLNLIFEYLKNISIVILAIVIALILVYIFLKLNSYKYFKK